nr:MAG TPA: hypothetical protein [Caudoviricetes sp.]
MKKSKIIIIISVFIAIVVCLLAFTNQNLKTENKKITGQSLAEEANQKLVVIKMENYAFYASIESDRNIPSKDLLDFSALVKSKFSGANWFSSNTGSFYIKQDKSERESILTISDGAYCAKITIDDNHKLTNYSFEHEKCRGYQVYATNSD